MSILVFLKKKQYIMLTINIAKSMQNTYNIHIIIKMNEI